MHCANFIDPISSPKSSITGKIDIFLDCIKFNAKEIFERDLIVKGVENFRSFTLNF